MICQGDLSSVVPLENASMPGRVVVQWDKDDCADMGLIKVDLLGLGMMAVLQDAIRLVNADSGRRAQDAGYRQGQGTRRRARRLRATGHQRRTSSTRTPHVIDLAHLPQDPAVYAMLQAADTIGVFQVESRAQMATLPRLKPTCFYDLVVQVAIIRPGPIVGQMVHPYLNRRAGREPVVYDHPLLEPVLKRTLGVPLFQEQLLRMAMVVAGFSGGQAEELRRAMGFKRSEKKMRQLEVHLREGMAKHGITGEAADRIVLSITSFALYGFPESHAASFALLAYASAYLKMHFPAAFYTALLNNQPMGFYHPATLVKDAQRRGVRFAPIDVQVSDWDCTVTPDGAIRLGLRYVSGLREEVGKAIAALRPRHHGLHSALTIHSALHDRLRTANSASELVNLSQVRLRRSVDDRASDGCFCNVCSHQWTDEASSPTAVCHDRRSRASHQPAARRDPRARRSRRAEFVRHGSPLGAVAGGTGDSSCWGVVRSRRGEVHGLRPTVYRRSRTGWQPGNWRPMGRWTGRPETGDRRPWTAPRANGHRHR